MASEQQFRKAALALEGVTEVPHMERVAFRVARNFVTLAADRKTANFLFTPDEQELKCTVHPEAFAPVPGGWGRQGWTTATLSKLTVADAKLALEMAWAHAQPKKRARK